MTRPEPIDLLITGVEVLTMDPQHSCIDNAAIAVHDGAIHWIGGASEARARFRAASILAAPGRIAMPGLIDTHFHTAQQLLRGTVVRIARRRQLRLPVWRHYLIPFESVLDEEDVYLSGLVAYVNMLRVGTTCFAEAGGPHPDQMARAAQDVGIRGCLALSTLDQGEDIPPSMRLPTDKALQQNRALIERWTKPGARVQAWLSLRQLLVCSEELWEGIRDLAEELDVRIHTHLAEGTYEVDHAAERWGRRPAERLADIGILGPRLHAAHSVLLSSAEVDLYAERRPTVAHCPMGNFVIGPPRVLDLQRRGVAVGVGSDGGSGGSIDLLRALQVSAVALQGYFGTPWHDRSVLSPDDQLAMGTREGARALGLDHRIGTLEIGHRADIVLIDLSRLDIQPVSDLAFAVARCASGADVESVVVDGKVLIKERELMTVDEEELRHRVNQRLPAIMERFDAAVA